MFGWVFMDVARHDGGSFCKSANPTANESFHKPEPSISARECRTISQKGQMPDAEVAGCSCQTMAEYHPE